MKTYIRLKQHKNSTPKHKTITTTTEVKTRFELKPLNRVTHLNEAATNLFHYQGKTISESSRFTKL